MLCFISGKIIPLMGISIFVHFDKIIIFQLKYGLDSRVP